MPAAFSFGSGFLSSFVLRTSGEPTRLAVLIPKSAQSSVGIAIANGSADSPML